MTIQTTRLSTLARNAIARSARFAAFASSSSRAAGIDAAQQRAAPSALCSSASARRERLAAFAASCQATED
jgi:hypothetical protein